MAITLALILTVAVSSLLYNPCIDSNNGRILCEILHLTPWTLTTTYCLAGLLSSTNLLAHSSYMPANEQSICMLFLLPRWLGSRDLLTSTATTFFIGIIVDVALSYSSPFLCLILLIPQIYILFMYLISDALFHFACYGVSNKASCHFEESQKHHIWGCFWYQLFMPKECRVKNIQENDESALAWIASALVTIFSVTGIILIVYYFLA